jgi:hypothetical protein
LPCHGASWTPAAAITTRPSTRCSIRDRHPGLLEKARSVQLSLPPYTMHTVVKPTPPGAPNEARFHVRYVTAVAAACGGPIVP